MERVPDLSPEQAAVVECDPTSGHLLVLARPGSGKTLTLAARARKLLDDGIAPSRLLAMTFSRRAAGVLKDRLPPVELWAGTFHAVSADILERHGAAVGVRWPFRIADEPRAREFLLRAITAVGYPLPPDDRARRWFLGELTSRIERRKRQGQERGEPADGDRLDADLVVSIDERYCGLLREANTLDYADLIANAVQVLEQDEPAAEALRGRLAHLLVDEVHDISPEQYRLMALLAPARSSSQVFVVGDPDQSIYEWRGAHANRVLARFRSEYRPREFQLTVNFRSRAPIVGAADALMGTTGRTRPSRPHRAGNVRPVWCRLPDAQAEAREIAATIVRALDSGSLAGYGSFAVLYRTHVIGNLVEAELLKAGIPINRVQPERFFHDPDAQESLRYLELALGLHDDGFEPALNWPRVIVDEVTMTHLRRVAADRGLRLVELVNQVEELGDAISPLTRGAITEFRETIGRELESLVHLPIAAAIDPFLAVLKRRRCPIPRSERETIRDTLDLLESSLADALAALETAIGDGRRLAIRVLAGPDFLIAALIVRHALSSYLGIIAEDANCHDDPATGTFELTLGEERAAGSDGMGLGALVTRTVHLSVATRAWRLMQMVLMKRETLDQQQFLLLDVETSNRHPERAEILEFAAMPFVGGATLDAGIFGLVRPSSPAAIDPEATDIHGLRWIDVADAPAPRDALPPLIAMVSGHVVVGHNIEEFDLPVLRQSANRAGLLFQPPLAIDTRRMAMRLWPEEPSYRLEDLARRFDPIAVQQHRACNDCLLAGRVFAELLRTARRDREIDVLSECLPLVAAGIIASACVVAHDNEKLTGIGARALGLGHGASLFAKWETLGTPADVAAVRSRLAGVIIEAPAEDERWDWLSGGWKTVVEAFSAGEPDLGIASFLQYAALAQPIDSLPREAPGADGTDARSLTPDERVALMTVHSAKGLEWRVVFLAGVEDDQFPLYRAKTAEQIAEERRTLYVGMTRAEDRLMLFSTGERDGRAKRRSPFLDHLVGDTIAEVRPSAHAPDGSSPSARPDGGQPV